MNPQLESVLEAYAAAEAGPSRVTLAAWIRVYPQFAKELTDFTASWQLLEWAGDATDDSISRGAQAPTGEEDEQLILRGISVAQSVFYAKRAARETHANEVAEVSTLQSRRSGLPVPTPGADIDSLLAAANRAGLAYAAFKERVGLSDVLLQKLNRRLVDPLTVPVQIIADVATALQQRIESVKAYMALAPTFAAGAQHRANQAPMLPNVREDFFDAVRNDATLDGSRKKALLALPRPQRNVRPHEGLQ